MTFVSVRPLLISTSETHENKYFQAIPINKRLINLHTVSVASPLPLAVTWMFWLMSLNCGMKTTTTTKTNGLKRLLQLWLGVVVRVCVSAHLGCPCAVVVVLVKIYPDWVWPPGKPEVHVQIIFWFLGVGPVLCHRLVHYDGGLEWKGANYICF